MATILVYNQASNTKYKISFDLKNTPLVDLDPSGESDFYILVSTTMRKPDGTAFPYFIIRDLSDIPPGTAIAGTNFSDLCTKWITYFIDTTELIASSSSSSTSSSSSSYGYSSSSSSNSSSSSSSSQSQ